MPRKKLMSLVLVLCLASLLIEVQLAGQDMLGKLGQPQNYASKRISSFDRTGGNKDSLAIEPGQTAVPADIKGPGAIHHIWVTIAAEPFYGRKIVLRAFWDGRNTVLIQVTGKAEEAKALDFGFLGYSLTPSSRAFITDWNFIGPFDAPDMDSLLTVYPPEKEIVLDKKYSEKGDQEVAWTKIQAEPSGYIDLTKLVQPNEQAIVYGFGSIFSPAPVQAYLLLGSDDGVRVWINGALVHSNPAYRGAYPDQDTVKVSLKAGWNKVLIKVLQGAGGWGYYVRFVDPDGKLKWSREPQK